MYSDEDRAPAHMKLTPQHLAEVLNALTNAPSGAGVEKRRAARMDVQSNVVVAPLNADGSVGAAFTALTRNISFVGIGLLLSKPLTAGQQVIVRLPRGAKPAMLMVCHVMHVRPLADGLYAMGVEFVRVAEAKQDPLSAGAAPGDGGERRARQVILN
jgi:hypothetical protein